MDEGSNPKWEPIPDDDDPLKPKRTLADLEADVSAAVIRDCKIDACVGWFSEKIRALRRSAKIEKTADWIKGWPDVTSLAPETAQQVEELRSELKHHLARLMPDEFTEDMDILADHPDILERLERNHRLRYARSPPALDHHIKALLDGLLRSHEVRLPGTQPESQDDHAPPTTAEEEATTGRRYFTEACTRLRIAIEDENSSALFACGGSIPVVDRDQAGSGDKAATTTTTSPVQVYWSTARSDSTARKLVLPLDELVPQSSAAALDDLVAACQPASFGRNGEEILDPSYRLAGKIDPANFASSFHPADFGILQMVENVLLPGISEKDLGCEEGGSKKVMSRSARHYRKLHAELYKLNVYSGPSGHFATHVDTPRSGSQIGSLVVCLPSQFSGGRLTVRHGGQQSAFDWSEASQSAIQWAAFYSDCEHEIETITEGHRLTLTYNLYITQAPTAKIDASSLVLQPQSFPLYNAVHEIFSNPRFMEQGGVLGVFCSHAYAHTSNDAHVRLPRALKGADLVVYSVLKSLGAEVSVLPVLGDDDRAVWDDWEEAYCNARMYQGLETYLKEGGELPKIQTDEFLGAEYGRKYDLDRRWKLLLLIRRVPAVRSGAQIMHSINSERRRKGKDAETVADGTDEDEAEAKEAEGVVDWSDGYFYRKRGTLVAPRLWPYGTTDYGEHSSMENTTMAAWPFLYLPGITWLNRPKHAEMAFSHITYGNEAGVGTQYSYAAIFAAIPPLEERKKHLAQ
ncbi:hypothetical protein ASPACDRAFT_123315 [Aspergillus aculeatus ATCC 16872]|uniref:Fe2OG dioxygenase domain-containing protein n=1 Tax=Aspergillus aculeatus (strain ATCC 16872 / CBS 172.66 / WB 5094) TaxID=690307 RepID=A0A1L9WMP9_ASPA1|nr:uncharacterized protein ASPACDRAFT_123315 [Aspergillus aculeatus ATCC 16872]OJJ97431.1 hypothetical protein ASPACDRAFT_123315 [Aspergillus aculeatus ATCC 16872]